MITNQITNQLGGTITFNSKENVGSIFRVVIELEKHDNNENEINCEAIP